MNSENKNQPRSTFFERLKAYFGFAEPGLTKRERLRIFAANERRSWNRLLGSRRPEDACRRDPPPAAR